jgi:Rod binding domain-containing protein
MGFDIDTITNKIGGATAKPTADAGLDKERIRTLAEQFESTMISQMLKGMQTSLFENEEEGTSSSGIGPLSDALFGELSQSIAKAGGFGIANAMMGPLTARLQPCRARPISRRPPRRLPLRRRPVVRPPCRSSPHCNRSTRHPFHCPVE